MNQIRERCQLIYRNEAKKLAVFVSEKSTEFTYHRCHYRDTSSVHRHLRNIKQRQSYAESHLWETKEGGDWLNCWYLQSIALASRGHRLRKSISIFRLLHLETANRVFCQCLERTGSTAQRTNHRLWTSPSRGKSWRQPIGIWVGGDETFYSLPILGHGISQWIYLQ